MDFQRVEAQLLDLPATFRRQGAPYSQFIDALTAMLTRMTVAADGSVAQGNFLNSSGGWADCWGQIAGIIRGSNVPDSIYLGQIAYAMLARGGPPLAITAWIYFIFGIQVELIENQPGLGYTIVFPATLTLPQIAQIVASIKYVRPAGVPFIISQGIIGTYLETVDFLNSPKITGAYLAQGSIGAGLGIGPTTNNSPVSVNTYFLTDPTLNPIPPT